MLDPCDAYSLILGWLGTLSWLQLTPRRRGGSRQVIVTFGGGEVVKW